MKPARAIPVVLATLLVVPLMPLPLASAASEEPVAIPPDAVAAGVTYSPITGLTYPTYKSDTRLYILDGAAIHATQRALVEAHLAALPADVDPHVFKIVDEELRERYLASQGVRDEVTLWIVLLAQPTPAIAERIWAEHDAELQALVARQASTTGPEHVEAAVRVDEKLSQVRAAILAESDARIAEQQAPVLADLAARGFDVLDGGSILNDAIVRGPLGDVGLLLADERIAAIQGPGQAHATLDMSSRDAGADVYWNAGFTGTPYDGAHVDTGQDCTHPAFSAANCVSSTFHTVGSTRACYNDSTSTDDVQGHGTHVAGIMASAHATQTGMAKDIGDIINVKAGWRTLNTEACGWAGGSFEWTDIRDGLHWATHLADPPESINLSIGGGADSNGNSNLERLLDAIVYSLRISVVVAAGNTGTNSSGVVTCNGSATSSLRVGTPGAAFNVITVGNADDRHTDHPNDNTFNTSSCRGPTNDGRMKPDLVAPGTQVYSAAHNWEGTNSDWVDKTGTSMAAPHVAGGIVLMNDERYLEPLQTKALLHATALQTTNSGAVPNYNWGFGNLYLDWTYSNRAFTAVSTVDEGQYRFFRANGYVASGDRYALVWDRHADYVDNNWPSPVTSTMSDLDLKLWREGTGAQDSGSVQTNNFEWLAPSALFNDGIFTVRGYTVVGTGLGERFALAGAGQGMTLVTGPVVGASISGPSSASTNVAFTVTLNVQNTGDVRAHGVSAELLTLPSGCTRTTGAQSQPLASLTPSASASGSWTITCTTTGAKTIQACGRFNTYGALLSDCRGISVTITAPNAAPGTPATPTGTTSGTTGSTYSYSTSGTDPDGNNVYYTFDWGDGTTSNTGTVASGATASASKSWSSAGSYCVRARSTDTGGAQSAYSSCLTVAMSAPNSAPSTPAAPSGPSAGQTATSYSYSASATDPNGDSLYYTFDWGDGTTTNTGTVSSGTSASASKSWGSAGSYCVRARATDNRGAVGSYSACRTVSIGSPNSAPNTPATPSGPSTGETGWAYTYSTSATDPNGNTVSYTFDWGDGTTAQTSPVASGATGSFAHTWNAAGTYCVRAFATDQHGATSGYSACKSVTISAPNSAPSTPGAPSGPSTGSTGGSYSYSTSATDPNGNNVYYTFDWGDGTTTNSGTVASGASASASHAWGSAGSYCVRARATDTAGAQSAYGACLTVTISGVSDPDPSTPTLQNGQSVQPTVGTLGSVYYKIYVPAGAVGLDAVTTGTGCAFPCLADVALYVRQGARPDTTYDCGRQALGTNSETCSIANPAAGWWYIEVFNSGASGRVTLTATYRVLAFSDNMESGSGKWSIADSGGAGTWGITTYKASSPTRSMGIGGAGGYAANSNDALTVAQPIDLRDMRGATLTFQQYINGECPAALGVCAIALDYGYVQVSTNGGTSWTNVLTGQWNSNGQFQERVVDLAPYVGNEVLVRFVFVSNLATQNEGWFVDDVKVVAAPQ